MITDALVNFIPVQNPLVLVGGNGITFRSGIIDLLGLGVGVAPGERIIGQPGQLFGEDAGVGGRRRPEINVSVTTAITANLAGTLLKIALQAAPDTGAAGGYQPGAWTDVDSQDNIAPANLVVGAVPFRSPFIPTFPANLRPRFMSLLFSPTNANQTPNGSFATGAVIAVVTTARDDQANKFQPRNYSVA